MDEEDLDEKSMDLDNLEQFQYSTNINATNKNNNNKKIQ